MSRTSTTRLGAFALSLLLVGFLVVTGSRAAFTDTTDNTGNNWATGTVSLSDDDTTLAMFNASGLKADDVIENCLVVTYDGSLDSDVTLYAAEPDRHAWHISRSGNRDRRWRKLRFNRDRCRYGPVYRLLRFVDLQRHLGRFRWGEYGLRIRCRHLGTEHRRIQDLSLPCHRSG